MDRGTPLRQALRSWLQRSAPGGAGMTRRNTQLNRAQINALFCDWHVEDDAVWSRTGPGLQRHHVDRHRSYGLNHWGPRNKRFGFPHPVCCGNRSVSCPYPAPRSDLISNLVGVCANISFAKAAQLFPIPMSRVLCRSRHKKFKISWISIDTNHDPGRRKVEDARESRRDLRSDDRCGA